MPIFMSAGADLKCSSQGTQTSHSSRNNKHCHFILDIMDHFWLAKTSNKPISLMTRLAVNPNLGFKLNL